MIRSISEGSAPDMQTYQFESLDHWRSASMPKPECGGQSGVYFLFMDDELLYVGKSINVGQRVFSNGHGFEWNRFAYKEVPIDDLDHQEALFIGLYKPSKNTNGVRKTSKRLMQSAREKQDAPESED